MTTNTVELSPSPGVRERLRKWAKPPRKLTMTAAGKFFVLLSLAVGFGAVNTGNNLLFLLMGMLLSLIIASGVLSEAVLRKLQVSRKLPSRAVAGRDSSGTYIVGNQAAYPALSLEIADLNARPLEGPLVGQLPVIGVKRHAWWKMWKKHQAEGLALATAYVVRIEPHTVVEIEATVLFPTRGRYVLESSSALTRFPFGLFEKSREWEARHEILVEPAPITEESWHGELVSKLGEVDIPKTGSGEEFFGLRDFREGEDARNIHWKSSARRGSLLVRETQLRHHRRVTVVVLDTAPEVKAHHLAVFESGISRAAGLLHRLHVSGYTIGESPDDFQRIMDQLAVVSLSVGVPHLPPPPADAARVVLGLKSSLAVAPLSPDDLVFAFDEVVP